MTLLQRQTRELEHDNVAGCEKLFGTVSVRECCVLSGTERESSESREARVPEREEIFHETGDGEHRSICGPSPASTCVHRLALLSSRVLARRELVRLCHRIRVSRHVEPRLLNLDSSHFSYLVMSYVNPAPPSPPRRPRLPLLYLVPNTSSLRQYESDRENLHSISTEYNY